MARERSAPPMEHLNVRIPAALKFSLDKFIALCHDTTLQAGVAEALELWLSRSSDLGSIGLISPKDRATVEEFAAALTRRDDMAIIALRLMEIHYDQWRQERDGAKPA